MRASFSPFVLTFLLLVSCCSAFANLHAKKLPRSRDVNVLPNVRALTNNALKSHPSCLLRGGDQGLSMVQRVVTSVTKSPPSLFNAMLSCMTGGIALWKLLDRPKQASTKEKPAAVALLQARFLAVFWLIRMADWLQGPYFFEVYHSKSFNGVAASIDLVSRIFLTGFAVTGAFGPIVGKLVDRYGRKRGTLAFAALYALSALSTRSNQLGVVLLGRVAGGLGTSLLFSAPEAWLVGDHERNKLDGKWLAETFGLAYAGDAVVAILAGQLAGKAAQMSGPTGPFTLSLAFLVAGAAVTLLTWRENAAPQAPKIVNNEGAHSVGLNSETAKSSLSPITEALQVTVSDKKILLLGTMQALFEGAMYIFVLQWPPLMRAAVQGSWFGTTASVPYGTIFSCLMASCLVGSTAFAALQKRSVAVEHSAPYMLATAAAALSTAAVLSRTNLIGLSAALFLFEACVGMYFPTIGTLRSKYLPDRYRSIIMNLFGIPLNLIVISVVLFAGKLGTAGALKIAAAALGVAAMCAAGLKRLSSGSVQENSSFTLKP